MANKINFLKNYLTSEELAFIVNEVIKHDNAVEREIVKIALIAQLLIDDLGEFENCNDVYDKVVSENIDFSIVFNYNALNKMIDEEVGMTKVIKDFVNDMTEKITKSVEGLDLNSAVSQLKEIADKDNIVNISKPKSGRKAK